MFSLRVVVVVVVVVVGGAKTRAQAPLTNAFASTTQKLATTTLGSDGPRFVLYLRADGAGGTKPALAAALAVLARIPGAGIDLYIEPNDRDAPSLADALAELPSAAALHALLGLLAEQDLPRWADSAQLARLARQAGLSSSGLRATHTPFGVPRIPGPGRALLRRPPGVLVATRSYLALAGQDAQPLTTEDVERLATLERWPTELPSPGRAAPSSIGSPLAAHQVAIRASAPLGAQARAAIVAALPLYEAGRIQLRIELDVENPREASASEALINTALAHAAQAARIRILTALLATTSKLDDTRAVWLLQSVGVDPVPLLAARAATPSVHVIPSVSSPTAATLAMDGLAAFAPELERRATLPSLRQRIGLPRR